MKTKKYRKRTSLSISMDAELAKQVKVYCLKHNVQISQFVIKLIKNELGKEDSNE